MDLQSPDPKVGMTELVLSHLLARRLSLPARPSEFITYKTNVLTRSKLRMGRISDCLTTAFYLVLPSILLLGSHAAQNSRILAHDWFRARSPQVIQHSLHHLLPSVTCICHHVRAKKVTHIPAAFVGLTDITWRKYALPDPFVVAVPFVATLNRTCEESRLWVLDASSGTFHRLTYPLNRRLTDVQLSRRRRIKLPRRTLARIFPSCTGAGARHTPVGASVHLCRFRSKLTHRLAFRYQKG